MASQPETQLRMEALAQICQQFNVAILYFFGSRAKEVQAWLENQQSTLTPGPSDVDIGVKPLPAVKWPIADKIDMAVAMEDWLNVDRVDLVSLDDADPFLAANIIRGERLYANDHYLADEYDLYVLRRAGDLAPLERERMALIMLRQNSHKLDQAL